MRKEKSGTVQIDCSTWARVVLEELLPKKKGDRLLLGITGSPAAGKSTFAAELVNQINIFAPEDIATVVPMDGYHFSNEELDNRQLKHLKGVPSTFDGIAYVDLIRRLRGRHTTSLFCPLFDRSIEASIRDAIEIKPTHSIVVSEGNYLLLDSAPWHELRDLFDEIWFLDVTREEIMPRLKARHFAGGRNEEQARVKMESTDLPNARLIEETKGRASRVIRNSQ